MLVVCEPRGCLGLRTKKNKPGHAPSLKHSWEQLNLKDKEECEDITGLSCLSQHYLARTSPLSTAPWHRDKVIHQLVAM